MKDFLRIIPISNRGILIDFEPKINENLLVKLLSIKKILQDHPFKVKVEVTNTYSSLLISYSITIDNIYEEVSLVKRLVTEANIQKLEGKQIYQIPVCYEKEFALDLPFIAKAKRCSEKEIIRLHSDPIYTVYFIGFLPGFLYLGGLDDRLSFPRKNEPRLRVIKGAVGIGGDQTGIYPKTSPGGWQIIGNSPVPLFDVSRYPPCEISAGDKLQFYQVGKEEHLRISKEVANGTYRFEKKDL